MSNLYAIGLILFGAYFGSQLNQVFTVNGEYQWGLAIVLAVTMYGALALVDLAFKGIKIGFAIGRFYLEKAKARLK